MARTSVGRTHSNECRRLGEPSENARDRLVVVCRRLGELKRDMNIRHEPNVDSLYKPIERRERVFRPLQIPSQLQHDLPFHLKPKTSETNTMKDPVEQKQRVAVVMEPKEKQVGRRLSRTHEQPVGRWLSFR
jgi:hypothetical protein